MNLCRKCGTRLTEIWPDHPWHPTCAPDDAMVPGMDYTYGDMQVIETIKEVIVWGAAQSARSRQVALGCSEIGDPCRRKIAMTMAGVQKVNFAPDPWPSIVGTSIHTWLESAVNAYQLRFGSQGWLTELEVLASPWLPGHVDLYHRGMGLVLDLKNPSRTNYRKMKKEGIGDTYFAQIQGYGKGVKRLGKPVRRVGILSIPRDGNLTELWCKSFPFDEPWIDAKIAELEKLGQELVQLDVLDHPERWNQIEPTPSRLCGWCPFYNFSLQVPGAEGCPGRLDNEVDEFFRQ